MAPTKKTATGEARVVDGKNFPVSRKIAAALVIVKPGLLRELHWYPNASEWQYYIQGAGRMTVFNSSEQARTMDFNANDVGFVPAVAGHYVENTGDTDLVSLRCSSLPNSSTSLSTTGSAICRQRSQWTISAWIRRKFIRFLLAKKSSSNVE